MSGPLALPQPDPGGYDISTGPGRIDTNRLATKANLDKAGQQFEAVFTRMMLKSMRQPHLADELFGSKALDTFRDMMDEKLADVMAATHPIGIGTAVTQFLAQQRADLKT